MLLKDRILSHDVRIVVGNLKSTFDGEFISMIISEPVVVTTRVFLLNRSNLMSSYFIEVDTLMVFNDEFVYQLD